VLRRFKGLRRLDDFRFIRRLRRLFVVRFLRLAMVFLSAEPRRAGTAREPVFLLARRFGRDDPVFFIFFFGPLSGLTTSV